ncbi:CBS domain-containing protein, partial [Actinomycetospora chlora]|uniref:CBS domain-containing protein n=1 Tax=Actinomycetospora chlora TaxID=663608 RepID=UPI0031E7958C
MQVEVVMTRFPVTVRPDTELRRAAETIAAGDVGTVMVVDVDGRFVGTLDARAVLRALLPDAAEAQRAGSVAAASAVFLTGAATRASRPVDPLVDRDPITLRPGAPVAEAAVVMADRGLRRLPVVADGRLLGTVSEADICRAVLAGEAAGVADTPTARAVPTVPAAPSVPTSAAALRARAAAALAAARA